MPWLKISHASALFLSVTSRKLVRTTDTSMSLWECPGELKWHPTGSSVFADVERKTFAKPVTQASASFPYVPFITRAACGIPSWYTYTYCLCARKNVTVFKLTSNLCRKSCENTCLSSRVPKAFLVLPNLHSCFYNSTETENMFLPPQGFGPEAKTRGGIIVVRAYIDYIYIYNIPDKISTWPKWDRK